MAQPHNAIPDHQSKYGTDYLRPTTLNTGPLSLYSCVSLNQAFPESDLKQGDVPTFIDTIPDPEGLEEGYIIAIFNALGESITVVTVPQSALAPLRSDEVPRVRSLR
ncbi:MAG: DUF4926 domain-containing protein [Cyanobacteria bacterium J06626_14]